MISDHAKDASSKLSLSPIDEADESCASNTAPQSGLLKLMKKAVFGIPHVATALLGGLQELVRGAFFEGIFDGMNAQESLGDVASEFATALCPYFYALFNVVQPVDDNGEMPIASDESDSSSCGQHDINDDGMFQKATSRDLNAQHSLYHAYHEEENVDDFLLRNAHIIDAYLENVGDSNYNFHNEDTIREPSECSWVMVPRDPNEDTIAVLSNSFQAEEGTMAQEGTSPRVLRRHMRITQVINV